MKPRTREAMMRAGITYQMLGEALGKDHTHTDREIQKKLRPEQAGEFVRKLATFMDLPARERREIFREVVNSPGKKDEPLFRRISTEDPFEDLNEAPGRLGITDYRNAERDARDLFGTPSEEDS